MFLSSKKWLPTLLLFISALSVQASDQLIRSLQPRGFVNDYANVIPQAQEQQLKQMLSGLERQTGAEIAVVTLTSLEGGQIDDFSVRLYERWKLGKAGKDNGVMLLAAINDRKARIEVGYGLEGAIPDGRAGQILRDQIFPSFKRGQYATGLTAGAATLTQLVAREAGVQLQNQPNTRYRESATRRNGRRRNNPLLNLLFFIGFIYMAIRHPRLLLLLLLTSGRGGGRGYSSGGFGGGGFGGFGGGSSGGGGASGGW